MFTWTIKLCTIIYLVVLNTLEEVLRLWLVFSYISHLLLRSHKPSKLSEVNMYKDAFQFLNNIFFGAHC